MSYYINSPLDQFNITTLISLNVGSLSINLTNFALYFILSIAVILTMLIAGNNNNKVIPSKWSVSQESLFSTMSEMVLHQIGGPKGQYYVPLIYSLFMFILVANLISMIPYTFAVNSHLVFTLSLSLTLFLGYTILGFYTHKWVYFAMFVPAGSPLALVPVLVIIELLSYLSRSVSLGLRLGANILSGHTLLAVLNGFLFAIMSSNIIFFFVGFIPLSIVVGITILEFLIACIQAYVFCILACSYIKEALYLH